VVLLLENVTPTERSWNRKSNFCFNSLANSVNNGRWIHNLQGLPSFPPMSCLHQCMILLSENATPNTWFCSIDVTTAKEEIWVLEITDWKKKQQCSFSYSTPESTGSSPQWAATNSEASPDAEHKEVRILAAQEHFKDDKCTTLITLKVPLLLS
jgi:hypothetical protein